jgi:hypothetical protein
LDAIVPSPDRFDVSLVNCFTTDVSYAPIDCAKTIRGSYHRPEEDRGRLADVCGSSTSIVLTGFS